MFVCPSTSGRVVMKKEELARCYEYVFDVVRGVDWSVCCERVAKREVIRRCIKERKNRTERAKKATSAGFEPARAKPSRFLVCLLNHSDKMS